MPYYSATCQHIVGGEGRKKLFDVRIVEVRADNSTVQKKVKSKSRNIAQFVENTKEMSKSVTPPIVALILTVQRSIVLRCRFDGRIHR